jgi:hypothetical protein
VFWRRENSLCPAHRIIQAAACSSNPSNTAIVLYHICVPEKCTLTRRKIRRWIFSKSRTGGDVEVWLPS